MSKRMKLVAEKLKGVKMPMDIRSAIKLLKETAKVKFVESVDASINLGIDARKSEHTVRGSTNLPHGTGKSVRIAVFASDDKAKAALAAGAEFAGMEDLAEQVKQGMLDFDVVIAAPDAMRVVGQLGQILGPKGLMPNPKVGTVTPDVVGAVKNAKAGQARFRNDKAGIIHVSFGKINFEEDALVENLRAIMADIRKAKPSTSKGTYIKKLTLSTTMGPGVLVDVSTVE
ncbi:MAG: 50S ribosomal protein L1 [Gammaproteobacteria bacterium]|nr:50S ribosomal protein L1 [Gammaproteobacteria bacterium]